MTGSQPDLQPARFSSFDALENELPPSWRVQLTKLASGSEQGTLCQLSTPDMALLRLSWQPKTHVRLTVPANRILVVAPLSRRTPLRIDGRNLESDQLPLMHSMQTHDLVCGPDNQLLFAMFDREAFLARLLEVWQYLPASWDKRQRLVFHSPGALAHAVRSIESLLELLQLRPQYRQAPNCRIFEQELHDAFARGSTTEALQPTAARHQLAKAAAAHLARHLTESVCIGDLCARLNTSERLLRRGFTERFGLPPSAYLRVLRLQRIHRKLRTSTAAEVSVTRVACQSGVTHLGRFSADYHYFYGEYPSTTLRCSNFRRPGQPDSSARALAALA